MAEKKKSTNPKSFTKQNEPGSKPAKESGPSRAAVSSRSGAAVVTQPLNSQRQLTAFESGMRLFHSRKLREAREFFATAAEGPERDVANRARLHRAMCDRRLEQPVVSLHSAEDYYNYGVALINARNMAAARENLETALRLAPDTDHIHYALALAQALSGNLSSAYENLRRAIELEPRNRLIARHDGDLAPLVNQPPFDNLLYPEKKTW